jgi:hypothetical protein
MATSSKLLKNKQPLVKKPEPSEWPFRLVLASWILMQDEQLPLHPWLALSSLAFGGGERDRTDDPLLAKQVLSQLSYTPVCVCVSLVGLVGVEPTTPALSRRCSNQLSYRPQILRV